MAEILVGCVSPWRIIMYGLAFVHWALTAVLPRALWPEVIVVARPMKPRRGESVTIRFRFRLTWCQRLRKGEELIGVVLSGRDS